jgi:hypothetical protein
MLDLLLYLQHKPLRTQDLKGFVGLLQEIRLYFALRNYAQPASSYQQRFNFRISNTIYIIYEESYLFHLPPASFFMQFRIG